MITRAGIGGRNTFAMRDFTTTTMKKIVFALIAVSFLVSSCSQYTCATYSQKPVSKSKTKETRI